MEDCADLEKQVETNVVRSRSWLSTLLYNEFVPRWFKKKESKDMHLLPAFKLGIGIGLYMFSIDKDMAYINIAEGIGGAYLLVDSIYQFVNEMSQSKRAATLAIDLITSPFYLMSSRYRLKQAGTK